MKFIHTADVHLGVNPNAGKTYSDRRGKEIWATFARLIETCEEEGADLLLIAGDLFHRQPLVKELKEVDYLFSTLTKTQVVLIAGNHDYLKPNSYYLSFPWSKNVHFLASSRLKGVEFPELSTSVYGFSYDAREILEPKYDAAKAPGKSKIEILLAHGGDERHIPIKKEALLRLGYDYVALGHIHKPDVFETGRAAYAGALEPIDSNDTGVHGFLIGELTEEEIKTRFVPFAKREYKHLDIEIGKEMTNGEVTRLVADEVAKNGLSHMYKITLTGFRDKDIVLDTRGMDAYGNALEIIDKTKPAYDFARLKEQNKDNLLGQFIEELEDADFDSVEYQALYEGVHALLETKKG